MLDTLFLSLQAHAPCKYYSLSLTKPPVDPTESQMITTMAHSDPEIGRDYSALCRPVSTKADEVSSASTRTRTGTSNVRDVGNACLQLGRLRASDAEHRRR